ncbi:MAG: pentapeptide repeat-containing protein, partial [Spirulinaceae cyanobacterium]
MKAIELAKRYTSGIRDFTGVDLKEQNLSSINLSGANLTEANLNAANLNGAILKRTNLSYAQLNVAIISNSADLSDANLSHSSLSQANLQGACLNRTNLEKANLNGANLRRSELISANLRGAELRQTALNRAKLSGCDLRGANLRWADLQGADLSWADLQGAKLSGANLVGANLSNANLRNTSLVHANLTQANLMEADWIGADLTGATLTGAKLYGVSRFGLKTEGLVCEWVDLSSDGDRRQIHKFTPEKLKSFFEETLPTVQINIDAHLDFNANLALAAIYRQISLVHPGLSQPPTIEVKGRKTTLKFRVDSNDQLFIIAYLAVFPFSDAIATRHNLINIVHNLQSQNLDKVNQQKRQGMQQLGKTLIQVIRTLKSVEVHRLDSLLAQSASFFQAPTHIILTNSSSQKMDLYRHPNFGKRWLKGSVSPEKP